MADPEWMETARKKGLTITGHGVNLDAVPGLVPVPDRAPLVTTTAVNGRLAIELFRRKCEGARNEQAFQGAMMEFAQFTGWRRAHFRYARVLRNGKETYETPIDGDGQGFLDLELVRERLGKIELKHGRNKPTPEQLGWYDAYIAAGVEAYIFWPKDCEAIIEVLTCHRPRTR
jgi:hypothetical protein